MNSTLPRLRCLSLLQLNSKSLHRTKQIHAQLIINALKSPPLLGKLIEDYCSSSSSPPESTKLPHLVFTHFDQPNSFLFNTLLRCSKPEDSIRLFTKWASRSRLIFDEFTFTFVLGACARFGSVSTLWFGRQVHALLLKHGFLWDYVMVGTTLIHFYANSEDLCSARKVFGEMPGRSSVTWNAMITGYSSQKDKASNDYAREAFSLFREMLVDDCGVRPTETTMVSVLSAVSQSGVLETGACFHGYIEKSGFGFENDVFIGTGLVYMYSKCGCLKSALSVFDKMKVRNVLAWTSVATGLAFHGKGKEALNLLDDMAASGVEPNEMTFTSLLTACCHVGLVQEGFHLFRNMEKKFNLVPSIKHYTCIVDLLGRAGDLKEAYEFILAMPVKPDAILWRSLLSACKVHDDAVMGEKVGKMFLELTQEQNHMDLNVTCEDYVALSNVYASADKWQEVELVRKEMNERRIRIKPGRSLVKTLWNPR